MNFKRAFLALSLIFTTTIASAQLKSSYKIGDIFDDGELEGVVFEVSADGRSGKIVSMTHSVAHFFWTTDHKGRLQQIGANSLTDGKLNCDKIKTIAGWEKTYPALKWCTDLGEGWYLPAREELMTLFKNRAAVLPKLSDKFDKDYWSSSEAPQVWQGGIRCAWYVIPMSNQAQINPCPKNLNRPVRAVAHFNIDESARKIATRPHKKYKVGQYYNDGTKEGIIFEVTEDGNHGKILSMTHSPRLKWAEDEFDWTQFVGTESHTNGAANMEIIKSVEDWQTRFPAFKWCADQGEGWYLPAKQELVAMAKNRNKIDPRLEQKLDTYWSSTEIYDQDEESYYLVWNTLTRPNTSSRTRKKYTKKVRAIAIF